MELSTKIMADVVESFLAALSLDQGLDRTEEFLERHLFPKLQVSLKGGYQNGDDAHMHVHACTCMQGWIRREVVVWES